MYDEISLPFQSLRYLVICLWDCIGRDGDTHLDRTPHFHPGATSNPHLYRKSLAYTSRAELLCGTGIT